MKGLVTSLICLICTLWLGAIAALTAQNPSLVSVRLLVLESVRIPLGLAIAGGVGVGLIAGALLQLFVRRP
ncbi:lipopolysaccharide assembly protein LapA domain-containing protein [Synechococcus elongatus]|uniref:Lipopolysaccharide assembly protein LapA domain-containing protein n=1 Tax=Synechococcus elongatus PCC 11802 TaxID=2283154 RepID=A0AAT9JVP6_SYNEL|nr:lipopolysaccharide assembly protein LapA domain-containing protein [Synechococcus elongatus]QFZ91353.1 DUF1049 domain-containing protein [Synechococcus elongatus PCC 11802]